MEQEGKFLESLEELKNIAATQGNKLTLEEIKQYFPDFAADDKKMELIYQYFISNRIQIADREELVGEEMDEDLSEEREEQVLQMYLEEIKDIKIFSEKEEEEVARKMLQGDEEAKILLMESKLGLVAEIAKKYKNRGLSLGDLIQEGNMGLLEGIEKYEGGSFHTFSLNCIQKGIETALRTQKLTMDAGAKIANQVNKLDEVSQDLARELGREATLEELASRMNRSEEEVKELMKISLDAISVVEPNMKK